jgi:class 3 adenylate cyclase
MAVEPAGERPVLSRLWLTSERRRYPGGVQAVTILFADVVHSMDIAATVGAERLREIMTDLVDRASTVVQRYDGTSLCRRTDDSGRQSTTSSAYRCLLSSDVGPLALRSSAARSTC